jgi:hypothetical protein
MSGPKAPRTFEEWVEAYEERDGSKYVLSPGERPVYDERHPERGFFTFYFDVQKKQMIIPKMCGDGRHWKPLILGVLARLKADGLIRRIYCFTKRNPKAFTRIFGGEIVGMEHYCDFETGESSVGWFIAIKE